MVEIEFKDVLPRLTVSQTRALLKIPPGTSTEQLQALTRACEYIVPQARKILKQTCRGRFEYTTTGFSIQLRYGSNNDKLLESYRFDASGQAQ